MFTFSGLILANLTLRLFLPYWNGNATPELIKFRQRKILRCIFLDFIASWRLLRRDAAAALQRLEIKLRAGTHQEAIREQLSPAVSEYARWKAKQTAAQNDKQQASVENNAATGGANKNVNTRSS